MTLSKYCREWKNESERGELLMCWKIRTTILISPNLTDRIINDHWAMDAELGIHGPF